MHLRLIALLATMLAATTGIADDRRFASKDLFDLQFASEVQIAPDGARVVYVRSLYDIMTDRIRTNLWMVGADGSDHRPLLSGRESYSSPRFSPDGERLAYVADDGKGKAQLFVRWLDSGETAMITGLTESPSSIAWSPDGEQIAFSMRVPADKPALASPPSAPEGADWAEPVTVIDSVVYRWDGRGYLEPGFSHVFVVSATGGAARQLTSGDYDHEGRLAWMPEGDVIVFSANRGENWQYERNQSNLYRVSLDGGEIEQLTELDGIARSPAVSPDGRRIAFEHDDHQNQQYTESVLGVIDADGDNLVLLGESLDRSMSDPVWAADSSSIYFRHDNRGERKVARVDLRDRITNRIDRLSGVAVGRPYLSGSFSVADNGTIAYTQGTAQQPADVHLIDRRGRSRQLTDLNRNLFDQRDMAEVHEVVYESSTDGTQIQGWYLTPPDFDPDKEYPLILEIHGGPHLAYGPHFSAELQRYAAEGYVVFYNNYRGSASYGTEFGMLLEYKYSSEDDFGDHMSGVDAMIDKGFIDEERLFITGGSAGGIATAYAIGLTDRFRAAAAINPVINWISKVLTGDTYLNQITHQFPGKPWEEFEHYWQRSPLSLVGNVTTPTLLMTGEDDFRTPIGETEQYYQALQLRGVDTVMIRMPDTAHGLDRRPTRHIAKIDNILAWFERHDLSAGEG
ncbi:alpha/beta hydrolase family protein [Wenzhouxiangella sp. AB-CW3]|uniref:alpha/beta hydrolase family protein n=1 Tax=Wenzhouxiangella sp. AB-CW3 TaxID=2771012 RepID=UPI001CC3060E|nr:S9 family peptidase [Wenzhouxiangella sp. AB-CW3]